MNAQLPFPISPQDALTQIVRPALAMLPARMSSPQAAVQMLAQALQESRLKHRRQIRGPARGLWQFETGGIAGVLRHSASKVHARSVCV